MTFTTAYILSAVYLIAQIGRPHTAESQLGMNNLTQKYKFTEKQVWLMLTAMALTPYLNLLIVCLSILKNWARYFKKVFCKQPN